MGQGATEPPSKAGSVTTPAKPVEAHAEQAHSHGHHLPINFTFIEQLKRRNIGRVALLYIGVAYVVLEVFELFFHLLEMPPWAGRAAVFLAILGFPVALLLAWAYEVTPQGLKPISEVPPQESIVKQTGRRLDRAIIVVLALALMYFVADKFWLSKHAAGEAAHETAGHSVVESAESPKSTLKFVEGKLPLAPVEAPEKSVAVLPFLDMSEKHDQEYFSDGLSEELIDMLVKIPGLKVPARTSSFFYKGKQATIGEIAKVLGVTHILEGSVRKSGDTLRVTAQLIRVDSGFHVWSQTFDRKFDDVFKVQDEIATAVAKSLNATLNGDSAAKPIGTRNAQAYNSFLLAKAMYRLAESRDGLLRAKEDRGGPTNLDSFRGLDKWNSAGYAAAASG